MSPHLQPILFALWLCSLGVQWLVSGTSLAKIRRLYPLFTLYVFYCAFEDTALYAILSLVGNRAHFFAYYVLGLIESLFLLWAIAEMFYVVFGVPTKTFSQKQLLELVTKAAAFLLIGIAIGKFVGNRHDAWLWLNTARVFERYVIYLQSVPLVILLVSIWKFRMPLRSRVFGIITGMTLLVSWAAIVNTILPLLSYSSAIAVNYITVVMTITTNVVWLVYISRPEDLKLREIDESQLKEVRVLLEEFRSGITRIEGNQ